MVYLTTRQQADRERLFPGQHRQRRATNDARRSEHDLGTVWVSIREEVEPELRTLFRVPEPFRLLW
jgi:hypothetical protein